MSVVYFVQRAEGGPIKIGCSAHLDTRIAQLSINMKAKLVVLATAPGSFRDEGRLHRQFAEHRLTGEWFADVAPVRAAASFSAAHGKLPPALEEDREVVMAARYLGGETLQEIANDFDMTRERVRQILRASNIPSLGYRARHRPAPRPVTSTESEIAEIYARGETPPAKLCERYGLHPSQLAVILRRTKTKAFGQGYWNTRADDEHRVAEVARLYREGVKTAEIAIRVGLSDQAHVYYYLAKAGISPQRRSKTALDDTAIVAAYQQGQSLSEIAQACGGSVATIRRRVDRAGILRDRAEAERFRVARVVAANQRRRQNSHTPTLRPLTAVACPGMGA